MSDSWQSHELYSPWNSPGQNTGVGGLFLLQGIFPTQGSNPGFPHCRRILYQLGYKVGPNYCTVALISHSSKVMLKILQVGLQQDVKHELPDIQDGFRKSRDQIAIIVGSLKKQESSRETSTSALLTMPKPLIVWITTNCEKFLKGWEYQTI